MYLFYHLPAPVHRGVTGVRGVFHPASLSDKAVLTRIETQRKVLRMTGS
jgi:hypothetical protein